MLSLKFMKDNKWFKFDSELSTVSSTTLREINETIKKKNEKDIHMGQLENFDKLSDVIKYQPALYKKLREKEDVWGIDFYQRFVDYVDLPNTAKKIKKWVLENFTTEPPFEVAQVIRTNNMINTS